MGYLSAEFLATYEGLRPRNAGPLFEITYLTKYSRWLEEEKRRETWLEIIKRVVEYSMSLYSGPAPREALEDEAELMFDYLFHLNTYPAGRSLWIAGTEAVKQVPESAFNCAFVVIDELEAFCDLFHLLMCGSGVGYRILPEDVAKLPKFSTSASIQHMKYNHRLNGVDKSTLLEIGEGKYLIKIGDSKQGWVKALKWFLELTSEPCSTKQIVFNYDYIRPAGERIKTFGGRAAGPEGLREMFDKLSALIQISGGSLSPVNCMDFCNIISQNVLVGGVRRSAQIALGSPEDKEFIEAKVNLTPELSHRRMSNNTIMCDSRPKNIQEILQRIRESWEPGVFNWGAAKKRRPNAQGTNPCSEISLDSRGVCNLSGSYIPSHIANGRLNYDSLEKSHRLASRIGLRQTNITMSLPRWDAVQKRDRLIGVSVTGLMDALDMLGWEFDSPEAIDLFRKLRFWANDEAKKYSFEMRVPRPLLVTCIKPEGTITLLSSSTSCGLHRSYSPQYIRRYKISNLDPVCTALKKLGVPNEPDHHKKDRTVFSFYINSGARMKANDESARKQLERYLTLMRHYVDHNASCTLTVGPDEWEDMGNLIYDNWDDIVSIALANKDFSENSNYTQLPYEAISEEEYQEKSSAFPDLSSLADLINRIENGEHEDLGDDDTNITSLECAGGFCPTR